MEVVGGDHWQQPKEGKREEREQEDRHDDAAYERIGAHDPVTGDVALGEATRRRIGGVARIAHEHNSNESENVRPRVREKHRGRADLRVHERADHGSNHPRQVELRGLQRDGARQVRRRDHGRQH